MKIKPHATDVIQVTGHCLLDGHDLHGMTLIVDAVNGEALRAHLTSNLTGIRLEFVDVEVIYRSNWT